MKEGLDGLECNLPLELISIDIQRSINELGLVLGENMKEDIIDRIFEQFCIGK